LLFVAMSLFGLGRNQKTFRPKKSAPSGSKVCKLFDRLLPMVYVFETTYVVLSFAVVYQLT
jgi:hypothetical protein